MKNENAADALISALTSRDFGEFARALSPSAEARLLLPRGPEVQSGRDDIARRFEGWFARATDFEVLDAGRDAIAGRCRLTWRFRLRRDGGPREVIEQVAFVDLAGDGVSKIDLMCSGFLVERGASL